MLHFVVFLLYSHFDHFIFLGFYEVIAVFFHNLSVYFVHFTAVDLRQSLKVNYRSSGPQIGAVLKKFAPFLKLYTDYIKNFDTATSTITFWTAKSAKFMSILDEIQVCMVCFYCSFILMSLFNSVVFLLILFI